MKARVFNSFEKVTFSVSPAEHDNLPAFTVKIKPFAYQYEAMDYITRFEKGPINGVSLKVEMPINQREVQLTITPSSSTEFSNCDREFRQAVVMLKKSDLTMHDSEKIISAYESYLKRNNINSELSAKVSKSPSYDFSGSVY